MRRIIVVICIVMFLSTATMAQSRARRTTKHPATTSKTTTTTEAAATVRTEGATRIASQIKSLSKFLYLVGGVVRGIEAIDAEIFHRGIGFGRCRHLYCLRADADP